MNILQRILKTTQKEAHPTVEELKISIQKMEEDLQRLQAELEKTLLSSASLEKRVESQEVPVADEKENALTKSETEHSIQALKDNISGLEVQLRVLRARVMVSSTTNTIKKQMAQLGSMGSVTLLENLKEKEATPPEPSQSTSQPLPACTPQAFIHKADALQNTPGPTTNNVDSTTEQP